MLRVDAEASLGDLQLAVDLSVQPGECLALVGPSGAGKSSVLRITAGLLHPRRGRVTLGDETWLDTSAGVNLPPERRRCGYVFQDYALFAHLTAWQNVAYGLRSVPRRERRHQAVAVLEQFGLAARAHDKPATLSGGERQRVGLARTIASRPQALLLDEPLSALDPRTRAGASRELRGVLREAGVPSILVTHDFAEAAAFGDRVAVLDQGRVVQQGTPAALAAMPASAFVADFAGAVVLTGTVRPAGDAGATLVDLDGGGTVSSTDAGEGRVAASVFPWELVLEPIGDGAGAREARPTSARNRLDATVISVTVVGGRARIGLSAGQPLVAEISEASVSQLGLQPGDRVAATWKAAATRLVLALRTLPPASA